MHVTLLSLLTHAELQFPFFVKLVDICITVDKTEMVVRFS